MAVPGGQTNTSREEIVHALNELDYHLQALKGADAWLAEVEDLNAKLGIESSIDGDLYKRVESNAVSHYAQMVVDAAKQG